MYNNNIMSSCCILNNRLTSFCKHHLNILYSAATWHDCAARETKYLYDNRRLYHRIQINYVSFVKIKWSIKSQLYNNIYYLYFIRMILLCSLYIIIIFVYPLLKFLRYLYYLQTAANSIIRF